MAERATPAAMAPEAAAPEGAIRRRVSVIIPARDEGAAMGALVRAVLAQQRARGTEVEVIVVVDGSRDDTGARAAAAAGARVLRLASGPGGGNPAAARNRGAAIATGDPLVFLDADCRPAEGWLAALLAAHDAGAVAVGGALELPAGLSVSARCDYYCGWYHVHARRPAGPVVSHPPGNLSVRRAAFRSTAGFTEQQPIAYAHEELAWQAALQRAGHHIQFEPRAVVYHHNRPGFGNLLRRNYRWAYSAIESKATSGAARWAGIYRHPRLLVAASAPLGVAQAFYITWCWVRARSWEPVLLFPAILAARCAYAVGMAAGGVRWIRGGAVDRRPRWE